MLSIILEVQLEAFLDSSGNLVGKWKIILSQAIFTLSGYKLTEQLINSST